MVPSPNRPSQVITRAPDDTAAKVYRVTEHLVEYLLLTHLLAYTSIVYLAGDWAPIQVFYMPIRYLEEFRTPDRALLDRLTLIGPIKSYWY